MPDYSLQGPTIMESPVQCEILTLCREECDMPDKINTIINQREQSRERGEQESRERPVDQCIDEEVRMRKYSEASYPYIPLENNSKAVCTTSRYESKEYKGTIRNQDAV